jgi:hypothetical protein
MSRAAEILETSIQTMKNKQSRHPTGKQQFPGDELAWPILSLVWGAS